MNSSSSIPFEIKRTTDSFNNGRLKERQISLDITPKKNSNPSSPSFTERNIVIDIQKKTEFVNVQTNTPHYEPSTIIYRASPYRKDRLNYSEYTNPGRSPNSSNYFNSQTNSNTNNNNSRTHKNRSVNLSSSTITELSENNYRTFDPVTPKSSGSRRKQNQIPRTEPRPKLKAFHHFTPPRYEPRPPTHGKTYLSQLSEDSGSSVYIDSSMVLLSEKDEEQKNNEKYDYESNDEILPIKRGPRYHFIMSSSDLATFSDEQNSSSSSRHSSRKKPRDINSASNYSTYSNYSYTNYSNEERNPEEDINSYESGHNSHRSRHDRHSYSHSSHQSVHHTSHHSKSKNSVEDIRRSRKDHTNDEDTQLRRTEKEYSDHNGMETPVQPRYTIYGKKRSPPKTQPAKKSVKSRNIDLDNSNSETNIRDQQNKPIHSHTQRIERTSGNHRHHSHTKSNASSSQMSKSVHSHTHSRSGRKSEPYYVLMKFVSSEELTEFDQKAIKEASFHRSSTIGDAFSFQDTTNYYATLNATAGEITTRNQPKKQKEPNRKILEEEEEEIEIEQEPGPDFDFNDTKDEESLRETDNKNKTNAKAKPKAKEDDEEESKNSQIKTRSKPQNEEENTSTTNKNDQKANPKEEEKLLNDEEFQKLVEVPPTNVNERSIEINDKKQKSGDYQPMQKGLIEKVEQSFNNQPSTQNDVKENPESNKQEVQKPKSTGTYQEMQNGLIEKVEKELEKRKEIEVKTKEIPNPENEDPATTENEPLSKSEEEQHSRSEEEQHSRSEEEQHSRSEEEDQSQTEQPSSNKKEGDSSDEIDNLMKEIDSGGDQKETSPGSNINGEEDEQDSN